MPEKILVVDDDPDLVKLLAQIIQGKGFQVFCASNGREALHIAYQTHPDLIILDLMMPEMDGWDFCYRLRKITDVPILVLTALCDEKSRVHSFELGADGLMAKPFNVKELELRIMALLRRTSQPCTPFAFDEGKLVIDLAHCQVWKNGRRIRLSLTEARLLRCLLARRGQFVSRTCLIAAIRGSNTESNKMSSLSFYIHKLRQKLEDDPRHPRYILSKWGSGYRFTASSASE